MARITYKTETPQLFILGNVQLYAVFSFEHEMENKIATYDYPYVDGVDYDMVGVGEEPISIAGRILSFENFGDDHIAQIVQLRDAVREQEATDFAHPELGAYRVVVVSFRIGQKGGEEGYAFDLKMKRVTTIREKDITQQAAEQKAAATSGTTTKTHTVVRGESLWRIAAHTYGDGRLWTKIWEANKKTLRSRKPHLIYPGEKLLLP